MEITFVKYQGTGNDFIIIDDRKEIFNIKDQELIAALCERRMGIGSDGLILLRDHGIYDFEMIYFNADGKKSSMCGNGARCIVAFAHTLDIIKDTCTFIAIDGPHKAKLIDGIINLQMQDVKEIKKNRNTFLINTGSPHYISFVDNLDDIDVKTKGSAIRYSEKFRKEGVNVNFVEVSNPPKIRSYERGVEDETLSCGTGVVAAAIALYEDNYLEDNFLDITTRGGNLSVSFEKINHNYRNIWLSGPAEIVYVGDFIC